MERRASLEMIAPTVEEAIQRGLQELNLELDQVQVEVLDPGEPGTLEAVGRQARVRLTLRSSGPPDPELEMVRTVVEELLARMHLRGKASVQWMEPEGEDEIRHVGVDLRGSGLNALVVQRGEALVAMQYLTRLIVAREVGHPLPVVIDAEGFRARREQQLRRMARRAAEQAIEGGRTVTLEPMPPADRRIIHLELRDDPHVYTESVGEGPHRKVTVVPKAGPEEQA